MNKQETLKHFENYELMDAVWCHLAIREYLNSLTTEDEPSKRGYDMLIAHHKKHHDELDEMQKRVLEGDANRIALPKWQKYAVWCDVEHPEWEWQDYCENYPHWLQQEDNE